MKKSLTIMTALLAAAIIPTCIGCQSKRVQSTHEGSSDPAISEIEASKPSSIEGNSSSETISSSENASSTSEPTSSSSTPSSVDESKISITLNKDTHLDGGDVTVNGTYIHFDENAVNENPSDSFVEIGPYGSIYLENYLPGLSRVYVEAKHSADYSGEFFLATSATPNSAEHFSLYSTTTDTINITSDQPYFSIHNHGGNNLLIDVVKLEGEIGDPEAALKSAINVSDMQVKYNANEVVRPYDNHPITPSSIPSNRIVKKIGPEEYKEPGVYTYGYEVYNHSGKMLYSRTAQLYIRGGQEQSTHLAIFHLPQGKTSIIPVANHGTPEISQAQDIFAYNWNSVYNDFTTPFYADRHYYPTYSVVGMPVNKDGDGCMPISKTYSALEKVIDMPEPIMDQGYKFGGWYMDQALTQVFDKDAAREGNFNLYANCIETERNFKRVYYHDYDGTLLNRIDILYEDEELELPSFYDIGSRYYDKQVMYRVMDGCNNLGMLRPAGYYYPETTVYEGDKLTNDFVKDVAGEIHLYVSTYETYYNGPATYTRFFVDGDGNNVISALPMPEGGHEGDVVLTGRYITDNAQYQYDFDCYIDPQRSDEFFYTDEIHGYLMDQGSYESIASLAYANKYQDHRKPLEGILRHESVLEVGRRAFFNRYGLKGTYFPRNARDFEVESYANTEFNDYLFLPKSLQTIGQRAFLGAKNIKYVALPKTLKSVARNAFALGDYDESDFSFKNIRNRTTAEDLITFYYEGSEEDYAKLDANTREEIENNAAKIVYNVNYNVYYGR